MSWITVTVTSRPFAWHAMTLSDKAMLIVAALDMILWCALGPYILSQFWREYEARWTWFR